MPDTKRRHPFVTAEWRDLVMLNYEADPACFASLLPRGTELDLCNGMALLSIVGFRFARTRLRGFAIPFHRQFEEVNLRFYVRAPDASGVMRRGVTFIRELVPRRAVALIARLAYNEPYLAVPMSSAVIQSAQSMPAHVTYRWELPGRLSGTLSAKARDHAAELPPLDSEACFITEHYWGFTRQRDGGTIEYEVEHPRWKVRDADSATLEGDLTSIYGSVFADVLRGQPRSAWIAEGSEITVYPPKRLTVNGARE